MSILVNDRCLMCQEPVYDGMYHECKKLGGHDLRAHGAGYGCICPPGANLTCQAPLCPRRGINTEAIS